MNECLPSRLNRSCSGYNGKHKLHNDNMGEFAFFIWYWLCCSEVEGRK